MNHSGSSIQPVIDMLHHGGQGGLSQTILDFDLRVSGMQGEGMSPRAVRVVVITRCTFGKRNVVVVRAASLRAALAYHFHTRALAAGTALGLPNGRRLCLSPEDANTVLK